MNPSADSATLASAPGRLPLVGHAWQLVVRPLDFLRGQRRAGDIAAMRLGRERMYLINNPELVRRVLTVQRQDFVKGGPIYEALRVLQGNGLALSDGDFNRRQRRFIQPTLNFSRHPAHIKVIRDAAAEIAGSWTAGRGLRADQEMLRLSSTIMARCLFSDALGERDNAELRRCLPVLVKGTGLRALIPVPWLHRLPIPANRRFGRTLVTVHDLTDRLIAERRRAGRDCGDVLSALLAAQDQETGESMPDQQIHDEVLTMLSVATETTGQALSWILQILSRRPDIDAQVHAELSLVLGVEDVTFAHLAQLRRLHALIREALRVYPPIWLFTRLVAADTELGGQVLPAGSTVVISPYANHHDAELFPSPEQFDPARWLADEQTTAEGAFIPFGAGPRRCIGETFAMAEMAIALATILRLWRMAPVSTRQRRPQAFFTLGPGPLPLTATPRQ
ncbi:cytochrome P450 [Kutzneria sp. NPDC052558]|uniref:cytochrome P450 n=1 Tax=Kutzneria sp. NPDC052558 TaxID=3364121 RepID=UPI0037C9D99F